MYTDETGKDLEPQAQAALIQKCVDAGLSLDQAIAAAKDMVTELFRLMFRDDNTVRWTALTRCADTEVTIRAVASLKDVELLYERGVLPSIELMGPPIDEACELLAPAKKAMGPEAH